MRSEGRLWTRALCWLLLVVLGGTSSVARAAPHIELFSPQGSLKDVRQVSVRFSAAMVAFGDPRLAEPFSIDCPVAGRGRWADGRNWVYDFEADLAAGVVCRFTLKADARSLAGDAFADAPTFSFDTGGASIRRVMPYEGSSNIDSDQNLYPRA